MGLFFMFSTQHFKINFLWQEMVVQCFMFCRAPDGISRNFDYVVTEKYIAKKNLYCGLGINIPVVISHKLELLRGKFCTLLKSV